MSEKTIQTKLGQEYVVIMLRNHQDKWVKRLPRRAKLKCNHDFRPIHYIYAGHGKWRYGCRLCGALCR